MPFTPDPASIAGTTLVMNERTEVLVIGGGLAGLAAALEAARLGRSVMLVDENPLSAETMGENVPLHFGGGMTNAVRNRNAMLEAVVASQPDFAEAFEAGIDIRLGTACWGLYAPSPTVSWLPGPVAGLMEGDRSWMVGAERIIVATGRRDMGLAFDGWDKDGVMGITAALRLATGYGALKARRAVVLGSTTETLHAAIALREAGVEIAAVVEVAASPVGLPTLVASLETAGTRFMLGHAPQRADGPQDGVESLTLRGADGAVVRINCDAVLLGIGAVPVIELLDAMGCRTIFDADRGGVVPVLDGAGRTSVADVFAVGDCAGMAPTSAYDLGAYRLDWVRASLIETESAPFVCQCEEVTAREILEVRPPRYLGWPEEFAGAVGAERRNTRDLRSLLGDAPPNPDQVKRLTRAGMGLCQGRRCREQVSCLLALATGTEYGRIPGATYRAPVRPMRMTVAATASAESAAMAKHWDTWFGMASQYLPPWDVPETYTAAGRNPNAEVASE